MCGIGLIFVISFRFPWKPAENRGWHRIWFWIRFCVAFNEHLYVARLRFFLTIVLGLNLLFFRYLSKIDASTHLRLYFKHICVVLLFLIIQENYLCTAKKNKFGSYPSLDPLDQANLTWFWHVSSKLIKEKYSGYILNIFMWFRCFLFIQENYPYSVKINNYVSDAYFDPLDQANLICFRHMSSKLIKDLHYILSIFICFCCF